MYDLSPLKANTSDFCTVNLGSVPNRLANTSDFCTVNLGSVPNRLFQ